MDQLHEHLRQLHTELEHGPPVDDDTRALLRTILDDINRLLQTPGASPTPESTPEHDHDTIIGRLKDATWELEESHPKLTTAASQLAEAIGRIFQ